MQPTRRNPFSAVKIAFTSKLTFTSIISGLTLLASLSAAGSVPAHSPSDFIFPQDFKWCVSTSAYQTEGGNVDSDWWEWEKTPGHIAHGEKSGAACDSWNRLDQDVELLKHLGVGVYRFSVEWARIEPRAGHYDPDAIEHYRREVNLLHEAGIAPLITLHHFTLPRWLRQKGGWEWEGAAASFSAFAAVVYNQIAPGARDWVTINEPMVHVLGGYLQGVVPPGEHRTLKQIFPVLRGLLQAHASAYRMLHLLASLHGHEVRVGMAHHLRAFDPWLAADPLDRTASRVASEEWNWMLPDALETGRLKMQIPFTVHQSEMIPGLAGTQDFIGVNYYTGDLIAFSPRQGFIQHSRKDRPKTDLGWDIYPQGFYRVLSEVNRRYRGKAVIVTENGLADANDAQRASFITEHLRQLARAIAEGVPVEGYCHWSLLDNFEWNSGFSPRFGLYAVDFRDLSRHARPSAELFRKIVQENRLNVDPAPDDETERSAGD